MRKPIIPLAVALGCVTCLLAALALARAPRVVHQERSEFNQILVQDEAGLRTLSFEENGAIQSAVRLGKPLQLELAYTRSAMVGLAAVPEPKRAMVVGLGGGAMPMFLRTLYPKLAVDAVDLDPAVVKVAKQFFDFREDETLKAHVGDGRAFVEGAKGEYDLIFLDAFGRDSIPRHLATLEFMQEIQRQLAPGGLVVGNVWSPRWNALYFQMRQTYTEAFGTVCILTVPEAGNRIFLARRDGHPLSSEELAKSAADLVKAKGIPFDLAALARQGCLDDAREAAVLHDEPKAP